MSGNHPFGGGANSFADQAIRNMGRLLRHPATSKVLHYALRLATYQLVKAIRNNTRTRKGSMTQR